MSENRTHRKKASPPTGPKVLVQQPSQHFETITIEEALAQSKGKGLGILHIPDMSPPGWEELNGIAASDMQTMNVLTELAHRLQHSGEVKEARRQARKHERRRQRKLASTSAPVSAPPAEMTPYSALLAYAAESLRGDERRAVEVLCDNNGSLTLADFAHAMNWDCHQGKVNRRQWSSLQTRLNKQTKLRGEGWRIISRDNNAILQPLPSATNK